MRTPNIYSPSHPQFEKVSMKPCKHVPVPVVPVGKPKYSIELLYQLTKYLV